MYRIAICDDDRLFIDQVRSLIDKILLRQGISYSASYFDSAEELMEALDKNPSAYDVLLLDILLEDKNGIQLARNLRANNMNLAIIFITSCPEFALDGYEVYPVHYLLKPVQEQPLTEALKRALPKRRSSVLEIREQSTTRILPVNTIYYLEVFAYHVIIHTKGQEVSCNGHLSDLEKKLPEDSFFRCHKSYLVNLSMVKGICRYRMELKNGEQIPVSKQRYLEVQKAYVEFAERNSPHF